MPNPVVTRKRKYGGSVKRERTADLVDARDHWLVVHHSSVLHTHLFHGEPVVDDPQCQCIWYFSTELPLAVGHWFTPRGDLEEVYVDVCLPARLDGRTIDYIDLDIDIVKPTGKPAYVKDLEAFERQRRVAGYPDDVVATAWRGLRLASEMLSAGAYPFDGDATHQLGRALAAQGPL
jgi:hypothetical protein